MGGKNRATSQHPETGRWMRRCYLCGEVKDLEKDFSVCRYGPDGTPESAKGRGRSYECKRCKYERKQKREAEERLDPQRAPQLRANYARMSKNWKERHPERVKASSKRFREKLKKDKERSIARTENARIAYRLRQERKGLATKASTRGRRNGRAAPPSLPSAPLGLIVAAQAAARAGGGYLQIAEETGVSDRTLRAWVKGTRPTAQYNQADKVLTAYNLLWFNVWDREHYPEVHEQLGFDE